MKKTRKLCLAAAVFAIALTLAACSPKTMLTGDEFTDLMEQAGYHIDNEAGRFESASSIRAVEQDDAYVIEFYVFSSEEQARAAFDETRDGFRAIGGVWSRTENNVANYNIYRGTNSGTYYVVSRIGDTLLYTVTDSANRDAVNEALELLGYQ